MAKCYVLDKLLKYDFDVALNVKLYFIPELKRRIWFLGAFYCLYDFILQGYKYRNHNAKIQHKLSGIQSSISKSPFSFLCCDASDASQLGCSGYHILTFPKGILEIKALPIVVEIVS